MKKVYQTEQRKCLLAFLHENAGKQFTIEQLTELTEGHASMGKSTIYRLMGKLVDEGLVRRFVKDNSRNFLYQIIECADCKLHFHLKCTECGKLIHLDDKTTHFMQCRIKKQHDFIIDGEKTLLFGKCGECRAKNI